MDAEGRLIVANPGLGYVWVLNHRAEPVEVIRTPVGASLTNLCFGGAEGKTLLMTESTTGAILSAEMSVGGAPVHAGRGA